MTQVGRITSAWRYPIKSMAGEQLQTAMVTLQGIAADRMYAFVQAESQSPFPWFTGREHHSLLRYEPVWSSDERPRLSVRTPGGGDHAVASEELRRELEEAAGMPLFLLPNYRGSFDVAAISLMSHATVDRIAEASETPGEPGRFRMNFYIETSDGEAFGEDAWVGRTVRIGESVRVAVTEQDPRCAMVTIAPHGGDPMTPVLTAIAELNDAKAGVYGSVLTPGEVREGDAVVLED
jgi:MOSC domain-containing protein